MKRFKEYKNLILSMCSLTATLLLLIVCVLGWYVTNKQAYVTGVVGSTESIDDFSFMLEYFDSDYDLDGEWVEVTDFDFEDMYPGDSIIFRLNITCNSDTTTNISTSFTGIKSSSHTLEVAENYVKIAGINLYEITNSKVTVNETETLYNISNGNEITLADYKLEDAMKVYYIEKRVVASDTNAVPVIADDATGGALSSKFISSIEIAESSNLYFAIRYEDLENNNYYAYQKLDIDQLIVDFK